MRSTARLTDAIRGHKKAVTYVGAAAALLGAGSGGAAAFASTAHAPVVQHHVAAATAHKAATTSKSAGGTSVVRGLAKPAAPAAPAAPAPQTWSQIQQTVAKQTSPSEPQAASQLQPVATAGPQAWMQLSPAQQANATTIVQQALDKGMGVRSAVIAVATSMQESQLQNINYGDQDSLGLFQQRPSMGWGTAQQILTPQFAADAFLTALQQQQAGNPGWANQPLWVNAQAVQKSGFPFAYAKWETQAVQLVQQIVTQVK
jgi:DNA uptake protein ComE-like DNA-binding protein